MAQEILRKDDITLGPWYVRIYSETLGQCYLTGCLTSLSISTSKVLKPIICNILKAPVDYIPHSPSCSVSFNARELSALNLATGLSSAATIADIGTKHRVGPAHGTGVTSTTATPAEWHIVKLPLATTGVSGAATFHLENRDIDPDSADFFVGFWELDQEYDEYDPNTGNLTLSLESNDVCNGEITITSGSTLVPYLTGTKEAMFVYNASTHGQITINGVLPIVEDNVRDGDYVLLVGVAYTYGYYPLLSTETLNTDYTRTLIEDPFKKETPISIKAVHVYRDGRTALVFRGWKLIKTSGIDLSFDTLSDEPYSLTIGYECIDDSYNHPNAPLFELERLEATTFDFDASQLL